MKNINIYEDNYNTICCYKLLLQTRTNNDFSNLEEYVLRGEWKHIKNNIKNILSKYNNKFSYTWFTYIDMYTPDFIQINDKIKNAKLYYNGKIFDIKDRKEIESKIKGK